jgi:hypothetical protein
LNYAFDLVALAASCFALYFIARAKKTYFLDSRFFIAIATVGFILYLAEATLTDILSIPTSIPIDTILFSVMGSSIGVAAYLAKTIEQKNGARVANLRRLVSRPFRSFLFFLGVIQAWTLASLLLQPWTLNQSDSAGTTYYYTYSEWYIIASTIVLVSFVGLPVASFYRHSRTVRDKTASLSMKIISLCWATFPVFLFLPIATGGLFLPDSRSVGFLVDGFLFVLISFALREPTVLARMMTAGEAMSQVVGSRLETDTIVLYNSDSDRRRLVETVVRDGLSIGNVVCRVTKAEVPFYRAVVKSVDPLEHWAGKNSVTIQAIESTFPEGDDAIRSSSLSTYRELVDLDELGLNRSIEIIDRITGLDRSVANRRTERIWALNVEGAQAGILELLTSRNPAARVIDLARQRDVFSSLLGLKHQDILGQRLLLEYEPTSNYEDIVQKFVTEFQANVESVAIFTNAGSPVYREFAEQRNIRLFSFSTKTSTPSMITSEQILLPERDTSLLLDAVDKLLQAHAGRRIGIIFEVFTYLTLSLGFEKTYGVISSVVEMVDAERAAILVLVNSDALEPRTLSGMRGLFQSQLFFDSNGLKVIKRTGETYGKSAMTDSLGEVHELPGRIEI